MEGIEMLNDVGSPRSKKKKVKSSSGSVSSRKSLKSTKSNKSKRKLKAAKKGSSTAAKESSSGSFEIEDNVSVISDDSIESLSNDDMSLRSSSSRKSGKSLSSKRSRKARKGDPERSSSMGNVKRGLGRASSSPKRSNSMSMMSGKKESKRSERTKRRGSMGTHSERRRRIRERRASNDSKAVSSTDGESLDQPPAQVTVEEGADGGPSAKPDESLPAEEEDMVKYMEERSKRLDPKDSNLALTADADQRVDLKKEVATLLAGVAGPKYVEDVHITVNGEKYESVKVNSLQWGIFRYAELMHEEIDVV